MPSKPRFSIKSNEEALNDSSKSPKSPKSPKTPARTPLNELFSNLNITPEDVDSPASGPSRPQVQPQTLTSTSVDSFDSESTFTDSSLDNEHDLKAAKPGVIGSLLGKESHVVVLETEKAWIAVKKHCLQILKSIGCTLEESRVHGQYGQVLGSVPLELIIKKDPQGSVKKQDPIRTFHFRLAIIPRFSRPPSSGTDSTLVLGGKLTRPADMVGICTIKLFCRGRETQNLVAVAEKLRSDWTLSIIRSNPAPSTSNDEAPAAV